MKIFVAYASRHGATAGIAERISETLQRAGLDVSLQPVENVESVDGYGAYVIGSAAYMGGWLGGATDGLFGRLARLRQPRRASVASSARPV